MTVLKVGMLFWTGILSTLAFTLCCCCAALPSPEQLDNLELRFLEDFCNLLVTAHYRLLTEQEWQTATDEEFTVYLYAFAYRLLFFCRLLFAFCWCKWI